MKNIILTILGIVIVGGSLSLSLYLTRDTGVEGMEHEEEPALFVEVAVADRIPLRETYRYSGFVEPSESVMILPKVTGIVQEIHVDLGDRVEKGSPLITIDDAEFGHRLKQAEANLQLAEAQLEQSRIRYRLALRENERTGELADEGLATSQESDSSAASRDAAEAEVDLAEAEVSRMKAVADEARLNTQNTRISSPMAGYVNRRYVDSGALASSSTPLLSIVKTDPAKVVVYLPQNDISVAEIGRRATVSVNGEVEFSGHVERAAPTLDVTTRTTIVEIGVPNPDNGLRPGMTVDVAIFGREEPGALAVPDQALILKDESLHVVVVRNKLTYQVPVTVGIQQDGFAQIVNGIEEGDIVVVKGQFLLSDGDEVDFHLPTYDLMDS